MDTVNHPKQKRGSDGRLNTKNGVVRERKHTPRGDEIAYGLASQMKPVSYLEFASAQSMTSSHQRHAKLARKHERAVPGKRQTGRNIPYKRLHTAVICKIWNNICGNINMRWTASWIGEPTSHGIWWYCVQNDLKLLAKEFIPKLPTTELDGCMRLKRKKIRKSFDVLNIKSSFKMRQKTEINSWWSNRQNDKKVPLPWGAYTRWHPATLPRTHARLSVMTLS